MVYLFYPLHTYKTRGCFSVHNALSDRGPYIIVLVELPQADNVRMVGNLLGDPLQEVEIGAPVSVVFEDREGDPDFTLVQWEVT